jgi:hypothetical protein
MIAKDSEMQGNHDEDEALTLAIRRNKAYNLEVQLALKKMITVVVVVSSLVVCLLYCNKCLWAVVVVSACHSGDSRIVAGAFMISLPMALISILPNLVDGGIYAAETIHNIRKIK